MKKLLFALVFSSVLLLIGCQESSITDPVSTELTNKVQDPEGNITRGTIPLEGLLAVPGGFNSYYAIEGEINYVHELIILDPIPPAPQYYVELSLNVRAVLTDVFSAGHNTFTIASSSNDIFYVSEEGIYILEKSYPLLGNNDGLVLVCRFLVTTDGVGLNAKWLAFADGSDMNKIGLPGDTLTYPPVKINTEE